MGFLELSVGFVTKTNCRDWCETIWEFQIFWNLVPLRKLIRVDQGFSFATLLWSNVSEGEKEGLRSLDLQPCNTNYKYRCKEFPRRIYRKISLETNLFLFEIAPQKKIITIQKYLSTTWKIRWAIARYVTPTIQNSHFKRNTETMKIKQLYPRNFPTKEKTVYNTPKLTQYPTIWVPWISPNMALIVQIKSCI